MMKRGSMNEGNMSQSTLLRHPFYRDKQKLMESENFRLLKRLQEKRSVYAVENWSKQRKYIDKIINMRTKYDYHLADNLNQQTGKRDKPRYLQQSETRFFEDYQIDSLANQLDLAK